MVDIHGAEHPVAGGQALLCRLRVGLADLLVKRIDKDKLARFLCRIQIRSDARPELDGAWYRAFDFQRWDYWASSADWEWGPWCAETGWSQPWIAGTLALRERRTSLWELVQSVALQEHLRALRPQMLPDEP